MFLHIQLGRETCTSNHAIVVIVQCCMLKYFTLQWLMFNLALGIFLNVNNLCNCFHSNRSKKRPDFEELQPTGYCCRWILSKNDCQQKKYDCHRDPSISTEIIKNLWTHQLMHLSFPEQSSDDYPVFVSNLPLLSLVHWTQITIKHTKILDTCYELLNCLVSSRRLSFLKWDGLDKDWRLINQRWM